MYQEDAVPAVVPARPEFSSGPCAKHPGWTAEALAERAFLGRSHRAALPKAQIQEVIALTRRLLEVPDGFRVGIVPASNTGALEMAMWNLLGPRGVDVLVWEHFGRVWARDAAEELQLADCRILDAPFGSLPDLRSVRRDCDTVFVWNGTTSGARVPDADWIRGDRAGLTICDATSAAFAQRLDWTKLDVTTFSWQKVLGGEAAHGVLILSPRAAERLATHPPRRGLPRVLRLATRAGEIIEEVFDGGTLNTPSMLCVADCLLALEWVASIGGLEGAIARADRNFRTVQTWMDSRDWVEKSGPESGRPIQHVGVHADRRSMVRGAGGRGTARRALAHAFEAGGSRRGAGRRQSPRCPTDAAGLVRCHRRWGRPRIVDAVARLGVPIRARRGCGQVPLILVADRLDAGVRDVIHARGVEVRYEPELAGDADALLRAVADAEGLAVRSACLVTSGVIAAGRRLKAIGRAGVGVDTIDVEAATRNGVVVLNAPFGNTITTAEHTIAMLLSLARHIPRADASLRSGRWERARFVGLELHGKTLGVIGCGNVGAEVATRALSFGMRVLVHDPFLPPERAISLGVDRVEDLDLLLRRSDIVTIHVPRTKDTLNLLSAERIAGMKPGARLVNCARGGIVDEVALAGALGSGALAGAAVDVFDSEPVQDHPLFGLANTVVTPHLGASTAEAQAKVSMQIAEDLCDFLLDGAVRNGVNVPSLDAREARLLRPWIAVAQMLGDFVGQVTESSIVHLGVEYVGQAGEHGTGPLTAAAIVAALRPSLGDTVNSVSALAVARARGMRVTESVSDARGAYGSYVELTVSTERQRRSIAGTVFSDGLPRIVQIKGVELEARPQPHMIYTTNDDKPGFIGAIGTALGEAGVNIATFALGRAEQGGEAIALLGLDEPPDPGLLRRLRELPMVRQVKAIRFQ